MIIPLRRSPVRSSETEHDRRHLGARTRVAHFARLDHQIAQIRLISAASMRGLIVVLGLLALRWSPIAPANLSLVLAAAALGCLLLALGYTRRLAGWPALAADAIVVNTLLYGTGQAASPLIPLTLTLILQGLFLGESSGALAGAGAGVAILVLQNMAYRHPLNAIVGDLAAFHLAAGLLSAWLWRRATRALGSVRDDIGQHEQAAREVERARQMMHWQRLNLQLATCATIDQLLRQATSHAQSIAGAGASITLDSPCPATEEATSIPIACGEAQGHITIYRPASDLGMSQRDAIEQLAALLGLRVARLRALAAQERQQGALTALWEIGGLLRVAGDDLQVVREALARLAAALDLDWLALLAPDELQALAPIGTARGRRNAALPLISGAQLRVAAEALRGERPLVRAEGAGWLVCLPICRADQAPLVVVARDATDDAATQALLMLFGDMVAGRLSAKR